MSDHLGDNARRSSVKTLLRQLQKQLFDLELMQTANNADDPDPLPGADAGPNGEVTSYVVRRKALEEQIERVEARYANLLTEKS